MVVRPGLIRLSLPPVSKERRLTILGFGKDMTMIKQSIASFFTGPKNRRNRAECRWVAEGGRYSPEGTTINPARTRAGI